MTNQAFYAYCRDQRTVEPDAQRKAVLADVYHYLRECGIAKDGVKSYIARQIKASQDHPNASLRIDGSRASLMVQ